nr:MAG TPA: hypothetical protein [Bacteriophage sp.]
MFSKARKIEKAWPIYYLHPPSYLQWQQSMYIMSSIPPVFLSIALYIHQSMFI